MVQVNPTQTMDTTYEYDANGNLTKAHTITVINEPPMPGETTVYPNADDDGLDVETGVELEGVCGMSSLEVFLTAAAGTIIGNLLYRIIRKS